MRDEEKRSNWNRPIVGPLQPGASKRVAVFGTSSELAYTRRSDARSVTFTCAICGTVKTEYRYPGFMPRYCSDICAAKAAQERYERRVAQQREKRRKASEARRANKNV